MSPGANAGPRQAAYAQQPLLTNVRTSGMWQIPTERMWALCPLAPRGCHICGSAPCFAQHHIQDGTLCASSSVNDARCQCVCISEADRGSW